MTLRVGEIYPYQLPIDIVGLVCVATKVDDAPYGAIVTIPRYPNTPIAWKPDMSLENTSDWALILGGSMNSGYLRGNAICRLALNTLLFQIAKDPNHADSWDLAIRRSYKP